jgi:hypothetical protein
MRNSLVSISIWTLIICITEWNSVTLNISFLFSRCHVFLIENDWAIHGFMYLFLTSMNCILVLSQNTAIALHLIYLFVLYPFYHISILYFNSTFHKFGIKCFVEIDRWFVCLKFILLIDRIYIIFLLVPSQCLKYTPLLGSVIFLLLKSMLQLTCFSLFFIYVIGPYVRMLLFEKFFLLIQLQKFVMGLYLLIKCYEYCFLANYFIFFIIF